MPHPTKLSNSFKRIQSFYDEKKRMPSYSEMAKLTRVSSKNAVFKMVERLSTLGLIAKDETGRLIPGENFSGVRMLGYVEAGFPSPAEEELSDTMSLDDYLIRNKEATFMLKVKGDSMIDAGIMPGDMVLVERGLEAREGDIVIAEVDHGWTMKYLRKKGRQVYLVPANKKYPIMEPREELNIAAIVKAVIRKY
jgi:SOS regulatory protein LexA